MVRTAESDARHHTTTATALSFTLTTPRMPGRPAILASS
jgi:hypothetical protein